MLEGDSPASEEQVLEELVLPPTVETLAPLESGTTLGNEGEIQVRELVKVRGRINRYSALHKAASGEGIEVDLREGPLDHPELIREAEVLLDVQYSMLPKLYASFVVGQRRYLATETLVGRTLQQELDGGLDAVEAISIVTQLTQVARRLQHAGWSLMAFAFDDVYLGQPLRLSRLGTCSRIGELATQPVFVAGYSAPEVAQREPVNGKESVYTLGAVLYRLLAKQSPPEAGVDLAALSQLVPIPGGPQVLAQALVAFEQRADLQTFYEALIGFRNSLEEGALELQIASGTTIGLNPTRTVNEDACGAITMVQAGSTGSIQTALLCVVDGMGGMEAGEVASCAALRAVMSGAAGSMSAISNGLAEEAPPHVPGPRQLIQAAARAVYSAAAGRQVGATITCTLISDGMLALGHVGDTRAYLARDGGLSQLTRDHSLVAAMVANGVLTPEQARGHPDSNKVLRSLGGLRELPDEYVDDLAVVRGDATLKLREGDWILLCSDGVWGSLEDEAMQRVLASGNSARDCVQQIIQSVLAAGAPDNATVVLAHCQAASRENRCATTISELPPKGLFTSAPLDSAPIPV